MLCSKCNITIDDSFSFCPHCGRRTAPAPRPSHHRTKGSGYIYKRGSTWTIRLTVDYVPSESGYTKKYITKGGFAKKTDASDYKQKLLEEYNNRQTSHAISNYSSITFSDLYKKMMDRDQREKRIVKSTLDCYRAARNYFDDIAVLPFAELNTEDWQMCIDDCPRGPRTRENMKALGTKLYKYAGELRVFEQTNVDYAQFIWIDRAGKESRNPFTEQDLKKLRTAAVADPRCRIIYAMCGTGFRPSEFLSLRHEDYDPIKRTLRGGAKTEAGKNRIVPVNKSISATVAEAYVSGRQYLFGNDDGSQMTLEHFREKIFYPALEDAAIQPIPQNGEKARLSPYSTRHTFSTLMKSVPGDMKDKAALMGHTSYEMTLHYQHEDYDSLTQIIDAMPI